AHTPRPRPAPPEVRSLRRPGGQPFRPPPPPRAGRGPAAKKAPPPASGGDDARALYDALTDDLLYDPAVGRATMMGYPCVRLAGRFVASYDGKLGGLVVKLPRERILQLVAE